MSVPEHRWCMRRTKAGAPCKQIRISDRTSPRSCLRHLTDEERAALGPLYAKHVKLSAGEEAARWRLALDRPPVCWFWPVHADLDRSQPERALREWQAGRCAICGDDRDDLVMDHSHETGMCRGLLCRSCNVREGVPLYRDLIGTVFAYYRQRPPTAVLGISMRYIDPFRGPHLGYGPPPAWANRWRDNAMRGAL